MFVKPPAMESTFFFEMKEERKVSYVKLVLRSIVAQKGANILFFYNFKYGANMALNVVLNLVLNSISSQNVNHKILSDV